MMARQSPGRWLAAHRRIWPWLAAAILVALLAVDLARVWSITNHHDLDVFTLAARRLVAGEDIYADAGPFQQAVIAGSFSMKDDTVVWPYVYPPLIALLFTPVLGLPVEVVRAGWWAVNVAALLAGTWLCLRALGRITPLRAALALVLLWRFEPVVVALRLGQIEVLQYLLLAATLYALSAGRERWAGVALGLATAIKFFPGALIVLLLWQRRWRAASWALGVALVAILGSFASVGLGAFAVYWRYTAVYGIAGAFAAFPLNQSLNGFFSRNLVHNVFTATLKGLDLPGLARALTLACDAVVVAVSAWLTWQPRRGTACRAPTDEASGGDSRGAARCAPAAETPTRGGASTAPTDAMPFALAVAALLLVSPHSQVYTFVWALIPLLALGVRLLEQSAGWGRWLAYVVAYALLGRDVMLYAPGVTRFFQSHYLFGALLLWGLLGLVWRAPACQQGAA
jgi:hypothetical protein